ncbi:MAG: NADH-quinone oxidoreductase subunit C [Anaerolineae bacterium]
MINTEHLKSAEALLAPWAKTAVYPTPDRLDITLDAADLVAAVQALHQAHAGYLSAITGLDHPAPAASEPGTPEAGNYEVLYHFCQGAAIITLRVSVPYEAATVPTVCGVIPSATLYERELSELLGIVVEGTPNTSRLLLADDWPEGVYPLRKSFKGLGL